MFEHAGYQDYADKVKSIGMFVKNIILSVLCSPTATAEPNTDLQPPASKRLCTSIPPPCYVKHHLVDLVRWREEGGAIRELEIHSNRTHDWTQSATQLGFKLGDITSTEESQQSNVADASGNQGVDDASNSSSYPKSWQELSNLLEDAKLGEVAKELSEVATQNRVRRK